MLVFKSFIQNAWQELNHVTWPTKAQIVRISLITIGFIIISAIVLGVIDYLLAKLFEIILSFK